MSKTLLALDTSTENCSAAVGSNGRVYQQSAESPREHSQRILPFVDAVLDEAGLTLQQLDGLVVGCGPGSFTGVRIGVSVAQGLAFSAGLPVYPVSSLQALAQKSIRSSSPAPDNLAGSPVNIVLAAIDARMNEIYYAAYENVNGIAVELTKPAVGKPSADTFSDIVQRLAVTDNTNVAAAGTGWDQYTDLLGQKLPVPISPSSTCRLPEARDMLSLVWAGQVDEQAAEQLEPLYVRNEVTWKKLPGRV